MWVTHLPPKCAILLASIHGSVGNMLLKQIVVLLLLALAQGYPALAQAGTQSGKSSQWPEVHLNVLVVDKSRQPQTTLDKSSFHVFENGKERPVKSISAGNTPVSLALLLDSSRSGIEDQAILKGVAAAVTRAMPPGSEVMAIRFADQAHLVLPFTPTNPFPLSFLNRLKWQGGTSLWDAIRMTEAYVAKNARYSRSALVVLSDGMEDHSTFNLEQTVPSLQWPGAPPIYFVRLPGKNGVLGYNKGFASRAVKLLVYEGGGLTLVPKKHQDPAALGSKIAALIRSQYVLTFATVDPALDGKNHQLKIRLTGQFRKLKVCALPSYFAPETKSP
jgi:Ca-activated chloride channel homolog